MQAPVCRTYMVPLGHCLSCTTVAQRRGAWVPQWRNCRRGRARSSHLRDWRGLLAFRFLFHRFERHAYFYSSIGMFRGLLICLTPVVVAKDPVFQLCIMALIIISIGLVSNKLQPWKAPAANLAEACLNALLVLLIVCGAANADLKPHQASIEAFATFLLLSGMCVVAIVVVRSAVHFLRPPVVYDVAICCSMPDSGAQARLVQVLFAKKHHKVYLPSDMGDNFDVVFDIMKRSARGLMVFLTRSCLTQPLCAGQIGIAHRAKAKLLAVRTPHFVEPLAEDLANLPGYLDISNLSLGKCGIDWDLVAKAYTFLLTQAQSIVMSSLSTDWISKYNVLARAFLADPPLSAEPQKPVQDMVLLACDTSDESAVACAGILTLKLSNLMPSEVTLESTYTMPESLQLQEMYQAIHSARAVVVILSGGTLQRRFQLTVIQMAMLRHAKQSSDVPTRARSLFKQESRQQLIRSTARGGVCCGGAPASRSAKTEEVVKRARTRAKYEVIPVVTDGFHFPTAGAYDVLFPDLPADTLKGIEAFFNRMPCQLSAAAGGRLLDLQVEAIACWLPEGAGKLADVSPTMDEDLKAFAEVHSNENTATRVVVI